ncbi:U6 snRNA phosphodiesterase 1 [Dermacentor variabilis]|uniref:U6 snRNA phosphodiesterase 1 n=1 Tax=Dermacentor variabilis TaxID=34621 RepID=UPI003F5C622F
MRVGLYATVAVMSSSHSLALLSQYASSDECGDSEDESAPAKCDSPRAHDRQPDVTAVRRHLEKPKLELPVEVLGLFRDRTDPFAWEDDKSRHDGRVRTFAHEPGAWASYVFVSGAKQSETQSLISLLCQDVDFLKPQQPSTCHVSLSRTVKLRHHWIQPMVESLKAVTAPYCRFVIRFGSLDVYTNAEKTRTFLSLKVHKGVEHLIRIVAEVDSCLKEYDLPIFYEEPSFHMSIAWCDASEEGRLLRCLHELQIRLEQFSIEHPSALAVDVSSVWFRSGNKLFELPLLQQ